MSSACGLVLHCRQRRITFEFKQGKSWKGVLTNKEGDHRIFVYKTLRIEDFYEHNGKSREATLETLCTYGIAQYLLKNNILSFQILIHKTKPKGNMLISAKIVIHCLFPEKSFFFHICSKNPFMI